MVSLYSTRARLDHLPQQTEPFLSYHLAIHARSKLHRILTNTATMPPKGGNAKKEGGRAKKAENEAVKKDTASKAKVHFLS